MGLEISQIQNAALKKLAFTCDTDDEKNVLSAKEFEIFKQEASKRTDISDDDFNQAMGLYTTDSIKTSAATEAKTIEAKELTKKQTKRWDSGKETNHLEKAKAFAERNGSRADFVTMLENQTNKDENFIKTVKEIIAQMPAKYTNTQEVDNKHKEVAKKVGDDDFKKDILEQLENMAKNECKNAAMNEVASAYDAKIKAYAEKNVSKTSEEIMDEIKAEAKKADKYKGDYKDAYKHFNKPEKEAQDKVYAAIDQAQKLEKGSKVIDKAKEILIANNDWDKYTKKALLGDRNIFKRAKNWLTGYKSDGKVAANIQARYNKVESKKIQTQAQIVEALGKRTHLFHALLEAGLIKDLGNGQYDLSELSNVIGTQVGTDAKLNRDAKKDKDTAEKLMTKSKLAALSKLGQELDDKDTKALVKLCGYEVEKKNIGKAIFRTLLGASGGAAATAGSVYAASTQMKDIQVPYYKDKEFPIDAAELNGRLPEGVTVDVEGNIHIVTDILVNIEKLAGQLDKLALYAALPGALIGGALGLASGLKDKGQVPKIPVNFSEMNLNDYIDTLKETNTEYAEVAIYLARTYVGPDGKWDKEGYKQLLNSMGGDKNGIINREELIGAILRRKSEIAKLNNNSNVNNNNGNVNGNNGNCDNNNETACNVSVKKNPDVTTFTPVVNNVIHHRTKNVGWKEIVEAYYPTLVKDCCNGQLYGANGAIRALQIELCTDDNGNIDKAKLHKMIHEGDVPLEIKLPLTVKGCSRKDDAKPVPGNYSGKTATSNRNKVGKDQYRYDRNDKAGKSVATDECNGHTAEGSTDKEAVENLEAQEKKKYGNRDQYIK